MQAFGLDTAPHIIERFKQGITSRLILFENAYLELISINNENAAKQHAIQTGIDPLKRANWQQTGASPFGISLRRCQRMN